MDGKSLDTKQDRITALRELFPFIFSEDKIDLEKFKAAFADDIYFHNERYTLNWAGKADAFKVLQERTSATLKPQPELSVNFTSSENVFIEGENLEVLKILQKSYYNKIKCIIIDPPYNTGNDNFIYPDRFKENLEDYEKRVGEKDEEGYLMKEGLFRKNSRENGHYHSNWLSMMLPRLFLARNLLRDDGVIFVHIDDNEVHNLRLLMNEIFGEENFEGHIHWRRRHNQPNDKTKMIGLVAEHIICYSKNEEILRSVGVGKIDLTGNFSNPDKDPRGDWASKPWKVGSDQSGSRYVIVTPNGNSLDEEWMGDETTYKELLADNRIIFPRGGDGMPRKKYFRYERESEGQCATNWWEHTRFGHNQGANDQMTELFGKKNIFSNPKPVELLRGLIQISNAKNSDIILDFFAGSATTAHAVLELNKADGGNRKFILVQLPELCDENSEAYKAGYKTIADISRERIRRVIKNLDKECKEELSGVALDLGFKSFKLSPSNFKVWRSEEITEENLEQQMEIFVDPVKPESQSKNMLVELMLKSGYLLTEKIENRGDFYYINNELVIALTKMNLNVADEIIGLRPQKAITLDRFFAGNDELKTNTCLQMRDAGVEFRTI